MGGACGRFVCEAVADVAEDLRRLRTKKIYSDATVARHRDTFKSLKLSEDAVARLHKVFRKIDQDGSGQIDLWELLDHLDLQRSKFAKRVFSIFDEDGTSTIDFREFVVTLWQYCTLGRAQLVLFAFDLYDRDSSGEIDVEELNAMLKELYGKRYASNNIAVSLLNRIRGMSGKDGASTVTMPVFTEFVRKHPAMLAPAFLMQQALRSKILGEKWWDRRAAERVHIGGKAVNIRALLAAHLSEETFHAFMMSVEEDQPMPDGHALTEAWDAEDAKKAVHSTGLVAQRRRSSGLSGPQGDVIDKYTDPARTSPQPARTSPQKTAARIYRLKSKIHLITVTAPAPSPPHSPATLPVTLPRPGHVRGESWRAAPPITTPPRTRAPSPMTTPPRHVPGESWRITSSITTPERRRPRITPHLSSMSAS